MKITVNGGSFEVSIETPYEGLLSEANAVFLSTLKQASTNDRAVLRLLQIILEHRQDDDAVGYAVLGLLGWYDRVIGGVSNRDIVLDLPKIMPRLIDPPDDLIAK